MSDNVVDLSKAQWGKNKAFGGEWHRKQKRRMRRHTRMVVSLKVLLPSLAALLIGLVIVWPQLVAQQEEGISLIAAESESDKPQEQVMTNPRFFTQDEHGEPINVVADSAFEITNESDDNVRLIQFNNVRADMLRKSDRLYVLDATRALYAQGGDEIELLGKVGLYTETGVEAETTGAVLNLKNKNVRGDKRILLRTPFAVAESEGFETEADGTIIRLKGKTKAIYYPDRKEKQ